MCCQRFLSYIIKIPRINRPKCVSCDRTIRNSKVRFLCTNLPKLFVSIEQRKRVTAMDAICDACRLKYVEWRKLTTGDFDEFDTIDQSYSESDLEVDGNISMVILRLFGYSI